MFKSFVLKNGIIVFLQKNPEFPCSIHLKNHGSFRDIESNVSGFQHLAEHAIFVEGHILSRDTNASTDFAHMILYQDNVAILKSSLTNKHNQISLARNLSKDRIQGFIDELDNEFLYRQQVNSANSPIYYLSTPFEVFYIGGNKLTLEKKEKEIQNALETYQPIATSDVVVFLDVDNEKNNMKLLELFQSIQKTESPSTRHLKTVLKSRFDKHIKGQNISGEQHCPFYDCMFYLDPNDFFDTKHPGSVKHLGGAGYTRHTKYAKNIKNSQDSRDSLDLKNAKKLDTLALVMWKLFPFLEISKMYDLLVIDVLFRDFQNLAVFLNCFQSDNIREFLDSNGRVASGIYPRFLADFPHADLFLIDTEMSCSELYDKYKATINIMADLIHKRIKQKKYILLTPFASMVNSEDRNGLTFLNIPDVTIPFNINLPLSKNSRASLKITNKERNLCFGIQKIFELVKRYRKIDIWTFYHSLIAFFSSPNISSLREALESDKKIPTRITHNVQIPKYKLFNIKTPYDFLFFVIHSLNKQHLSETLINLEYRLKTCGSIYYLNEYVIPGESKTLTFLFTNPSVTKFPSVINHVKNFLLEYDYIKGLVIIDSRASDKYNYESLKKKVNLSFL
ncbi:putative metalloprotease [Diachasmimorpha longicaudata entomopoxvirus]|uniref:Putative metalloprotease n=1 Tax=Diachasmimorpha longicaudata entomopoxvirus TaxID=109981 RepID=A0A7R5WU22_9POXV|nr:putative metalloprotease [Diachasmimorpha longicaudata entomopoxvirus]AKS26317.1 putative metalloprotease [Diachasmimorpha longicaudata entomopoxvirus]